MTKGEVKSDNGFLRKFVSGGYGLAKTYWLFYLLPTAVASLPVLARPEGMSSSAVLLMFIPLAAWIVVCAVAVNRASKGYGGSRIWPVLARIHLLLSSALALLATVMLVLASI